MPRPFIYLCKCTEHFRAAQFPPFFSGTSVGLIFYVHMIELHMSSCRNFRKLQETFDIKAESERAFVLCSGSHCEMNIGVKACVPCTPSQLVHLFTVNSGLCHRSIRVKEPQEESLGSPPHQRKNSITVALQHI